MKSVVRRANSLIVFLIFNWLDSGQACSHVMTDLEGGLQSPGYPDNYPNNTECTYLISVPPPHRITLTFHTFRLQDRDEDGDCLDYVRIYDGDSQQSRRLRNECGEGGESQTRTFQNQMWIQFKSDESLSYSGFNATYSTDTLGDFFSLAVGGRSIILSDLQTTTSVTSLTIRVNVFNPIAVDYNYLLRRVFFLERGDTHIHSVFINGTDNRNVADLGAGAVLEDIAVDPASSLIFYTDSGNKAVGVVTSPGTQHKRLVTTGVSQPGDIALNAKTGVLFWTEGNSIQRVNYDGSDRRAVLVLRNLTSLRSITLDLETDKLYWFHVDQIGTVVVENSDLDGNSRTQHLVFGPGQDFDPFKILSLESRLYFLSDSMNGSEIQSKLWRLEDNGLTLRRRWTASFKANDVTIFKESMQHVTTECQGSNGGCSHFCIPSPSNEIKCMCTDGWSSAQDGRSCEKDPQDETPKAAIIGGAVGAAVFIIVVVAVVVGVVICTRRRRREASSSGRHRELQRSPGTGQGLDNPVATRRDQSHSVRSDVTVSSHIYDQPYLSLSFQLHTGVDLSDGINRPADDLYLCPVYKAPLPPQPPPPSPHTAPDTSKAGYLHPTN